MVEPTNIFRRQQRRRAIIAWASAALVVALIAIGAVFGGEEEDNGHEHPAPFGYSLTADQYAALEPGLDEAVFVNRLEQAGLPEHLTRTRYVELFPPHAEDIECSYWEISDRLGLIARVCFSSSDARLVQKLERNAGDEPTGVTA